MENAANIVKPRFTATPHISENSRAKEKTPRTFRCGVSDNKE